MQRLPIDAYSLQIVDALIKNSRLILKAPPGSGKSTRVPQILYKAGMGPVWILEPRRVVTKLLAKHIAVEMSTPLGKTVGYALRFEKNYGPETEIRLLTEGLLLRELLKNQELKGCQTLILDEFHERHWQTDLCLALIKETQEALRADLKILVMSATLETESLEKYLDCDTLEIQSQSYPLNTIHIDFGRHQFQKTLSRKITEVLERATKESERLDSKRILVFLPGKNEINQCIEAAHSQFSAKWRLEALHGSLELKEQERILSESTEPSIIFTTNLCESALTVPQVKVVVDSGLERVLYQDPELGAHELSLEEISKFSATQRAGRAKRLGEGSVFRLWTQIEDDKKALQCVPEIQRIELSEVCMLLMGLGVSKLYDFNWFESPRGDRIAKALRMLWDLKLIESTNQNKEFEAKVPHRLTELGTLVLAWPLPLRYATLLTKTSQTNFCANALAWICQSVERTSFEAQRLYEMCSKRLGVRASFQINDSLLNNPFFKKMLLECFGDFLAQPREKGSKRYLLANGKGVKLSEKLNSKSDFLLALELRKLSPQPNAETEIQRFIEFSKTEIKEFVEGDLQEIIDLNWNDKIGKLEAFKFLKFKNLILEERGRAEISAEQKAKALSKVIIEQKSQHPENFENTEEIWTRLDLLSQHSNIIYDKNFLEASYVEALEVYFTNKNRLSDWVEVEFIPFWKGLWPQNLLKTLDHETPTKLLTPKGKEFRIHYDRQRGPHVSLKLQEVLGWRTPPTLLGGKVKILFELLAPNGRPTQTTRDLTNFWDTSYQEVRKELRARYPKHAWPEKP